MSRVLVIGCGGVASVAIHKCCQVSQVFTELCIASRTKSKCDKLAAELAQKTDTKITTAQVDADHEEQLVSLMQSYQPDLVMNIALPYHWAAPPAFPVTSSATTALTDRCGRGELLVFGGMAIYTTCKNNTFNGMTLPGIWILRRSGELEELRKFGYRDFKMRLGRDI